MYPRNGACGTAPDWLPWPRERDLLPRTRYRFEVIGLLASRRAHRNGLGVPLEGQDVPFEGQDVPFEGQDAPFEGQDVPFEGQDVPFEATAGCSAGSVPASPPPADQGAAGRAASSSCSGYPAAPG